MYYALANTDPKINVYENRKKIAKPLEQQKADWVYGLVKMSECKTGECQNVFKCCKNVFKLGCFCEWYGS